MIDLSRNRAELLAEIEATRATGEFLNDITDSRVSTENGRVCVQGSGRLDLFPLLKAALLERFSAVPRPELIRDLLVPLKNALGNASKHGNGGNPAKVISVELELTCKGALIAITDQGQGFNAALTFQRFQNKESYATNHGRGLLNLHRARSAVSYESDGRTVLLCFRPAMHETSRGTEYREECASVNRTHGTARPDIGAMNGIREKPLNAPVAPLLDPRWVQTYLPAAAPEFGGSHARIEACRVYVPRGRASDDCGIRYVLRVASRDGQPGATRILTGRLHATTDAATADFEFAARLHAAGIATRMLVPRPVALFAGEPRLVLYDFDPWLNLREYLAHRRSLKSVRHAAERAGEGLAALHRSAMPGGGPELEAPGEKLRVMIGRGESRFRSLTGESELLNRFRACAQAVEKLAAIHRPRTPALIHGALDWDCIQYGIEGRFYLYRFESCRWSDPGLDLGGFAAELLWFMRAHHDEAGYRVCRDALLDAYNRETEQPMSADELQFYIAFALIARLQWAPSPVAEDREWLAALETNLWGWQRPAEIDASA